MQEMRILILFIMLVICSIDDSYSKKINIMVVFELGFMAFLSGVCFNPVGVSLSEIIFGMLPGFILLLMSRKGMEIGEADGIIFIVVGAVLGMKCTFEIMVLSFFAAFVLSLFLLVKKKRTKGYTFAFVPFIFVSFCVVLMKNRYRLGSMTIELSLIMPGIMAVLILIIFMGYYLHDKCVIKRAAYVACLRETEGHDLTYNENSIIEIFEQLIDGKLLGKWQLSKNTSVDEGKISMNVSGRMDSPIGILNRFLNDTAFSVNMDAYSYLKP